MTKENKMKIGMALHGIALMSDETTFKKIKDRLKEIEDIVAAEPDDEGMMGNDKRKSLNTCIEDC